ncbi:MAG: hypothetical protein U0169_22490 [Polyangiaceae bacterium]
MADEPELSKDAVIEDIAVALVELKSVAQPHELAALRELELDARDADTADQLDQIARQVKNLRQFCESRTRSTAAFPAIGRPRW